MFLKFAGCTVHEMGEEDFEQLGIVANIKFHFLFGKENLQFTTVKVLIEVDKQSLSQLERNAKKEKGAIIKVYVSIWIKKSTKV